jgi:hypothetical protein
VLAVVFNGLIKPGISPMPSAKRAVVIDSRLRNWPAKQTINEPKPAQDVLRNFGNPLPAAL